MLKWHTSGTDAQMGTAGLSREKEKWPFAIGQPVARPTADARLQKLYLLGTRMGYTRALALGNLQTREIVCTFPL